jgi:putative transposase
MSRGNGRMTIFFDDGDYGHFMQLFRETMEDFQLECWNYCLMPNHYHATVQPTLPNLSSAIQHLHGRYASWWNRRYGKVGHVFQGRFKAQIVQREGYAMALSRYVALNPVRARMVERAEDWPWGSYPAIVGLGTIPPFLSVDATLELFGDADRRTLQKRFGEFVRAGCDDQETDERIRSTNRILGDGEFKFSVRQVPVVVTEAIGWDGG